MLTLAVSHCLMFDVQFPGELSVIFCMDGFSDFKIYWLLNFYIKGKVQYSTFQFPRSV